MCCSRFEEEGGNESRAKGVGLEVSAKAEAHDSALQKKDRLSSEPVLKDLIVGALDLEGITAATGAFHIWIVEFESGSLNSFNEVDLRSVQVDHAVLVHINLETVHLNDLVLLRALALQTHRVLETGTSSAPNRNSDATEIFRGFLRFNELFYFLYRFVR